MSISDAFHPEGRMPEKRRILPCSSFLDELYEIYGACRQCSYIPLGYAEAGVLIDFSGMRPMRPVCPHCGHEAAFHDHESKHIHGGSMNSVPIYITFDHYRFYCRECCKTFMQPFRHLNPSAQISGEALNSIAGRLGRGSLKPHFPDRRALRADYCKHCVGICR
jgi:RNase P subunit RPR2